MRKTIVLLSALIFVAFSMNSCFDNTGYQSTPFIDFGYAYVNPQFGDDTTFLGGEDTLFSHYNEELEQEYWDTLQLGDTLMVPAYFSSFMNNLVSVVANYDTARVDLWFDLNLEDEDIKKAISTSSNIEKGILIFNPMFCEAIFPVYVVPQEAGAHTIKITVTSDSEFPTNFIRFTLPVK